MQWGSAVRRVVTRRLIVAAALPMLIVPVFIPTSLQGAEGSQPRALAGTTTDAGSVPEVAASSVVDSFSGKRGALPDPSMWQLQTGGGGWGSGEMQTYTSSTANVSLDGHGHLLLTARRTGTPGHYAYTSGRIASWATVGPTLHAEARIKMAGGSGTWPTFWLMGGDADGAGWPVTGEVDVAESIGRAPNSLYATAHGFTPDATATPIPFHWQSATVRPMKHPLSAAFHTFALDVTSNSMVWTVDGKTYKVLRRSDLPPQDVWTFDTPFHVILSLAIGGSFGLPPTPSTRFPVSMVVDYVAVSTRG
jgi:beta-glucanase (GH16 family)